MQSRTRDGFKAVMKVLALFFMAATLSCGQPIRETTVEVPPQEEPMTLAFEESTAYTTESCDQYIESFVLENDMSRDDPQIAEQLQRCYADPEGYLMQMQSSLLDGSPPQGGLLLFTRFRRTFY